MSERVFTVDEANGLVATVDKHLTAAQGATRRMRDVRDQLVDLRIVWGDAIESETCADHQEYVTFRDEFNDLEKRLQKTMASVHTIGCVIKDVEQGLVDFPVRRGDEVVYLCWRRGEKDVRFWHSPESGFAGRQPVNTL